MYIWILVVVINIVWFVFLVKIFWNEVKNKIVFWNKYIGFKLLVIGKKKWSCWLKSNDLLFKKLSLFCSSVLLLL